MIKAVFIDIDGTLLTSERKITEITKNAINKCKEKGIKIILTSGRSRFDTIKLKEQANASDYIISSNGADVYDMENNTIINIEEISSEILLKLLNYTYEKDMKIKLNFNFEIVINKSQYEDEKDKIKSIEELKEIIKTQPVVQCVISDSKIEKMVELKKYLQENIKELKIENQSKKLQYPEEKESKSYYCDMTLKNVSKGNAVKKMCKYLGLNKNEIVTIGDGINDISMFEITQNSVVMDNAVDEVKNKARIITKSNDEDGVAKYLNTLI